MNALPSFTRKGFEAFCFALNHRLTRIESDLRWVKRIGYWMAFLLTAIGGKIIFFT